MNRSFTRTPYCAILASSTKPRGVTSPFFSAQPQPDQCSLFQSELWGFRGSTFSSDELNEVGLRADQRHWWQCGWVVWEVDVA